MEFTWVDYDREAHSFIEEWLDDDARRFTCAHDGWDAVCAYWKTDPETGLSGEFPCKVVYRGETPAAAMLLCYDGETLHILEILTSPSQRGKGVGSAALTELLRSGEELLGYRIAQADACIFDGNLPSQRAFEKADFVFESAIADGEVRYYTYRA